MHKSLDYVCGFSRVSQCSRNITHGFSGTSVYQIKYTVVSAYSGAFQISEGRQLVGFEFEARRATIGGIQISEGLRLVGFKIPLFVPMI
jgi:hypothetical protein